MNFILEILEEKCPLNSTFYDYEQDDETLSPLSPKHLEDPGFLIKFSTVNNVKYYALIYFSTQGMHRI